MSYVGYVSSPLSLLLLFYTICFVVLNIFFVSGMLSFLPDLAQKYILSLCLCVCVCVSPSIHLSVRPSIHICAHDSL